MSREPKKKRRSLFEVLFRRRAKVVQEQPETEQPLPPEPVEAAFNPFGRFAEAVKTTVSERTAAYEEITQKEIRDLLSQIAVIAFIGPSGTGKSTRAIAVARDHNIGYIIDDGLLIHGSSIVAGSSAKRAATKIESVRQALFAEPTRAANMRRALVEHLPSSLMILGTSAAMLERICSNLWLNPWSMLIRIEDVSTEEERQIAKHTRIHEGRHTIPVPSMEIKHEFSGYFAEPITKLLRRRERAAYAPANIDTARTVVRPTFSTLGAYSMSDEALGDLVSLILRQVSGIAGVVNYKTHKEPYGIVLDLDLELLYGYNAQQALRDAQREISRLVEQYSSINVLAVNVRASRVRLQHSPLQQASH